MSTLESNSRWHASSWKAGSLGKTGRLGGKSHYYWQVIADSVRMWKPEHNSVSLLPSSIPILEAVDQLRQSKIVRFEHHCKESYDNITAYET